MSACRKAVGILVITAALLLAGTSERAQAGWTVSGPGMANGQAGTLPSIGTPWGAGSGLILARTFTVRWNVPPQGSVPVAGYRIDRMSSLLGAGVISTGTCSGLTVFGVSNVIQPTPVGASLSCTDVNLVAVGSVRYSVTPVYQRWIGPASAWSEPIT